MSAVSHFSRTTVLNSTPADHLRGVSTAADTGFASSTSRPDSLAELARHAIFVKDFVLSDSEISDSRWPEEITGLAE